MAYQEGYEKLHTFFISVAREERLYKGLNLQRALLKQVLIGKIVGRNQLVLEVGCGEGLLAIALSRSKNCIKGTDVSQTCITLAKRNKERFGAVNADFQMMNSAKMTCPPNSFGWIVSVDLLEHLHPEDAKNHLIQANRILKEDTC